MIIKFVVLITYFAFSFTILTSSAYGASYVMKVHFIDVGQGASTLIEFPCAAMLIDTGGEFNSEFDGKEELVDYLENFFSHRPDLNRTINSLILTHPHIDHTRGVKEILSRFKILNAVTNGFESGSGKYGQKALHQFIVNSEMTSVTSDDVGFNAIWLKDIPEDLGLTNNIIDPVNCNNLDPKITALWGRLDENPGWTNEEFRNTNNHSIAIRIDYGQSSLLVSGDIEDTSLPSFINHYKNSLLLDVDVYQVNHHGSFNGTTKELLNALTPKIAVISMGDNVREEPWTAWKYGHPREDVINWLEQDVEFERTPIETQVATSAKTFIPKTITKAIYATGWDGTIILEANANGDWSHPSSRIDTIALVDLNYASKEELLTLPMIDNIRAESIIKYRTNNGKFNTIEDLIKIKGIGLGTVNALKNLTMLSD